MAFGISRKELDQWKDGVSREEISYLTHFWWDKRFPQYNTVTKVGCSNMERLIQWCNTHGLNPQYIHHRPPFPHFDLIGPKQKEILQKEGLWEQLERFRIINN